MTAEDPALLRLAESAVDRVVPRLRETLFRGGLGTETKSTVTDLVTEFDRWSEEVIVETILATRPDDGFMGEEGTSVAGSSGVVWVIDPIDGTTNFVYGIPGCSVSVAARVDGTDRVGMVHDLVRDERFRAVRSGGATLDGRPIQASSRSELATALVATGFSYDPARRRAQAEVLVEVLPRVRDIRRFGGAALDLCSVACGRLDAYYERGLQPWDLAAGALIAVEAGAVVVDHTAEGGALVAVTAGIADDFVALIEGAGCHRA